MAATRRDFLKSIAGATVGLGLGAVPGAAWGQPLGQTLDQSLAQALGQPLAQPGGRKFALLVGIDRYDSLGAECPNLGGCGTDLELQRQLLIHRFGFQPQDILVLKDAQATRQALEAALVGHFLQQVQPGDGVVFHFSGYGSIAQGLGGGSPDAEIDPDPETALGTALGIQPGDWFWPAQDHPTLVLADSFLPRGDGWIQDFPLGNLVQVLRALASDRVLVILDTSHSPNPIAPAPLGVRWRCRNRAAVGRWHPESLAFRDRFWGEGTGSQALPGLWFWDAMAQQPALELELEGFAAGALTLSLTQQLWQTLPAHTVGSDGARLVSRLGTLVGKTQGIQVQGLTPDRPYWKDWGLEAYPPHSCDGFITAVPSTGEVRLWLGGLSAPILSTALGSGGYGSQFTIVPGSQAPALQTSQDDRPLILKLQSRDGLQASAALVQGNPETLLSLGAGQGIQEKLRWIYRQPTLVIGLEPHLNRIERIDATSAFAAIAQVDGVPLGEVRWGDARSIDYIFGRIQDLRTQPTPEPESQRLLATHRYGLCPPGRDLLPGTLSPNDEAVKTAVQRLEGAFRNLKALKLLRSLINTDSTRLPLKLEFKDLNRDRPLARYGADRAPEIQPWQSWRNRFSNLHLSLPNGHTLRYQPQNLGDRPLYGLMILVQSDGSFALGYPPSLNGNPQQPPQPWLLPYPIPGDRPPLPAPLDWLLPPLNTQVELFCLISPTPFQRVLQTVPPPWEETLKPLRSISDPLALVQALLEDFHQASRDFSSPTDPPDWVPLEVSRWAVVRLTGQVQD